MRRTVSFRAALCLSTLSALAGACLPESDPIATTTPDHCGDGVVDDGEQCDDGNDKLGDGCSPECRIVALDCGNGVLDPGEECDDGNRDPSDECTSACNKPFCGDGFVHAASEQCDGDGCDATCTQRMPVLQATGFCALLFDGRVKCWGNAIYGALGLGDKENRGDEPGEMGAALPAVELGEGAVAVELTSGYQHNCARMQDGRLKCWGVNARGACGVVSTTDVYIGNDPGEMGDNLPYVDLGTGRTALSLTAGRTHTCAILDDNSLKCWGGNNFGQLGLEDEIDRGPGPGAMGDALPAVNLGTGKYAVQVAAADYHTCALLNDATVKCWGFNYRGRLGLGDTVTQGGFPGDMGDGLPTIDLGTGVTPVTLSAGLGAACVILDDGRVRCWGDTRCGGSYAAGKYVGDEPSDMGDNLADVDLGPGAKAVAIEVGNGAACALLTTGEMKCWDCGDGAFESPGLGDSEPSDHEQTVNLGTGALVASMYMDYPRACAILQDGTLKCWGNNDAGQLGLGDTESRGHKGTMGDNLPIVHVYDDRW